MNLKSKYLKIQFVVIAFLIVVCFSCGNNESGKQANVRSELKATEKPKQSRPVVTEKSPEIVVLHKIELVDIIPIFLLPENTTNNVMDWTTGSKQGEYPINWLSSGVETDNENPVKPYFRHGQAIIAINGNPITILERNTKDVSWDIYLIGARSFYSEIQIGLPITSRDLGEFHFDEYLQSQNIPYRQIQGFNEEITFGNKGYAVKFPGKQEAFINYEWSQGSAGLNFTLYIYFTEDELSNFEYKQ